MSPALQLCMAEGATPSWQAQLTRHVAQPQTPGAFDRKMCVQERGYAEKDDNMLFSPTPLGEALIGAYDRMGLKAVYECALFFHKCIAHIGAAV